MCTTLACDTHLLLLLVPRVPHRLRCRLPFPADASVSVSLSSLFECVCVIVTVSKHFDLQIDSLLRSSRERIACQERASLSRLRVCVTHCLYVVALRQQRQQQRLQGGMQQQSR